MSHTEMGKIPSGAESDAGTAYEDVNTVKRRSYTSRAPRGAYNTNRVSKSRGRGQACSYAEIPDTSNGDAPANSASIVVNKAMIVGIASRTDRF